MEFASQQYRIKKSRRPRRSGPHAAPGHARITWLLHRPPLVCARHPDIAHTHLPRTPTHAAHACTHSHQFSAASLGLPVCLEPTPLHCPLSISVSGAGLHGKRVSPAQPNSQTARRNSVYMSSCPRLLPLASTQLHTRLRRRGRERAPALSHRFDLSRCPPPPPACLFGIPAGGWTGPTARGENKTCLTICCRCFYSCWLACWLCTGKVCCHCCSHRCFACCCSTAISHLPCPLAYRTNTRTRTQPSFRLLSVGTCTPIDHIHIPLPCLALPYSGLRLLCLSPVHLLGSCCHRQFTSLLASALSAAADVSCLS